MGRTNDREISVSHRHTQSRTCQHLGLGTYTGFSVSVLVRLPKLLLRDSLFVQVLSVQYGYRDPFCTDIECICHKKAAILLDFIKITLHVSFMM
jgi:hypothetical protein